MSITGRTRVYAHIGSPIGHVRAPSLFNRLFEERGIDAVMVPFEVSPVDLESTIPGFRAWRSLAGLMGHWAMRGYGKWAVERKSDGAMMGRVGLINPEGWPGLEVGWTLGRSYWGKGYAFEAAQAVVDDGFGRLGLDEIVAYTVPANRRSWGLIERLGMTRNPHEDFDHPACPQGHPQRRHVLYRLHRPIG